MQKESLVPIPIGERIETVDIIRGIALLGIVIINFTVDDTRLDPWNGYAGISNQLAYWPIVFFLDDKFVAMFSFLFGLGFAIQMERAEARNANFVLFYIKRLFVLFLIGTVHQILTGSDILNEYAFLGFLLLPLRKMNLKYLPLLAVICIIIPWTRIAINENPQWFSNNKQILINPSILNSYEGVYELEANRRIIITNERDGLMSEGRGGQIQLFAKSDSEFFPLNATGDKFLFQKDSVGKLTSVFIHIGGRVLNFKRIAMGVKQGKKEMADLRAGFAKQTAPRTYKQMVERNAEGFWDKLTTLFSIDILWNWIFTNELPLFILGLYIGRRRIFRDMQFNNNFLKKAMLYCLAIGFIGVAIATGSDAWNYFASQIPGNINRGEWIQFSWNFSATVLALGYIAAIALLLKEHPWKKRLSFFTHVGRMPLTNYLLQSAAVLLLFDAPTSLEGKVGPLLRLILSFFFFLFLLFASRWWLQRYCFGPVEWLWRSLTYSKIQPMRKKLSGEPERQEIVPI